MAKNLVVGGRGDMTGASNDNGGSYESGRSWTEFQGANGGPVKNPTGCAYTTADGKITKNAAFAVNLDDLYVHTKEGGGGAWGEDWYKITASDVNSITIASGLGDNADIDVWVGGAFAKDGTGIQATMDAVAAGDTIKIATDTTTATEYNVAASITVDITAGTVGSHITVEGVDKTDGTRLDPTTDVRPKILGTAALANGLIELYDNIEYYDWWYLDFDGGGAGKADYCIDGYNSDIMYYVWSGCKFHNSVKHAAYMYAHLSFWINCEFYDAGKGGASGDGMYSRSSRDTFVGCSFHDNLDSGIYVYNGNMAFCNCIFYDNTEQGIELNGDDIKIINCTMYGNTLSGFKGLSGSDRIIVTGCTSSMNGSYQYEWNSSTFLNFSYNHAYHTTADKRWDGGNDATWAAAGDGNNITGDPLFASVADGSENFTPGNSSPLLGAGAPPYFAIAGDIDSITNYGHIGAVTRDEPAGGGGNANLLHGKLG